MSQIKLHRPHPTFRRKKKVRSQVKAVRIRHYQSKFCAIIYNEHMTAGHFYYGFILMLRIRSPNHLKSYLPLHSRSSRGQPLQSPVSRVRISYIHTHQGGFFTCSFIQHSLLGTKQIDYTELYD